MKKREEADRIIWCDPGFFPVHYGFCPSEAAWNREMKRLGCPGEQFPETDASATTFANKTTGDVTAIVCLHERHDAKSAVAVMAMLAHEAVHVWQTIRKEMGEREPSIEFEAYAIQDIVLRLGAAYEQSRRPKWARNRRT
jgi:hypothetical protein